MITNKTINYMYNNRVVVYTSGTFDMFHSNHLKMIEYARGLGDTLIVGVSTDELVSSYKRPPVIPFEERMEIVRNVKWVDQVIPSLPEDSDVYKTGLVKYDMLFVGSDYKGTERFNRYEEYFADKGVKIIYFPYTQSTSSTQIRNLIISRQNNG